MCYQGNRNSKNLMQYIPIKLVSPKTITTPNSDNDMKEKKLSFIAGDFFKWVKDMKSTQVSNYRKLDHEVVVYIHKKILLSHKEWKNLAIYSNLDETERSFIKWRK